MLSNDCYSYDSFGSDSSDSSRAGHSLEAITNLDHNYVPTIDTQISNCLKFDPMEPLFEDMSGYVLDDCDADFANAPTPFMASGFADLNDIESDDLLDFESNASKPIDDNNNINFVENEVEIGVNPIPHIAPIEAGVRRQDTNQLNPRKRSHYYSNEDNEEDYESEEDLTKYESKRKSKVGRKPSKAYDKCMSRNAIAARENRERKKAHIENIETRNRHLEEDNKRKQSLINNLSKDYEEARNEVQYLRGVLANDSTIGDLIKHMSNFNQIELIGTQFVATDSAVDSKGVRKSTRIASKGETSPQTAFTKLKANYESSGVCLHINNKRVSLELCAKCSQKHRKGK